MLPVGKKTARRDAAGAAAGDNHDSSQQHPSRNPDDGRAHAPGASELDGQLFGAGANRGVSALAASTPNALPEFGRPRTQGLGAEPARALKTEANRPDAGAEGRLFARSLTDDEVTQFIPSGKPNKPASTGVRAGADAPAWGRRDESPLPAAGTPLRAGGAQLVPSAAQGRKSTLLRALPSLEDSEERVSLLDKAERAEFDDPRGWTKEPWGTRNPTNPPPNGVKQASIPPLPMGMPPLPSTPPPRASAPPPPRKSAADPTALRSPLERLAMRAPDPSPITALRSAQDPTNATTSSQESAHSSSAGGASNPADGSSTQTIGGMLVPFTRELPPTAAASVALGPAQRAHRAAPRGMGVWAVSASMLVTLVAAGAYASTRSPFAADIASALVDPAAAFPNVPGRGIAATVPAHLTAVGATNALPSPPISASGATQVPSVNSVAVGGLGAPSTAAVVPPPPVLTVAPATFKPSAPTGGGYTRRPTPTPVAPATSPTPATKRRAPMTDAEKQAAEAAKRLSDRQLGDPML
jgi:hypothetical protein